MADQPSSEFDWEDIRVFTALARHGSLSAAARALSVNHGTISRRIVSLESALGEKLVERRPSGYVLTPAGQHALSAANEMEVAAASLRRGGVEGGPKGLVRINASPGLAHGFLIERLAKVSSKYPGIDIEVATDLRVVSLERREADLSLRLGRPQDGDVIARHLVTVGYGFYASPEWCRRIEDGEAPVFVGFDETNHYIPDSVWLAQKFPRARIAFRTVNQVAQAAAARAGAGIAMLPHVIGRTEKRLQRCVLNCEPPSRELWLIMRRQDGKGQPVSIVVDLLMQLFQEEREIFNEPEVHMP